MNLQQEYLQVHYEIISLQQTILSLPHGVIRNEKGAYIYDFYLHGKRRRFQLTSEQYSYINDGIQRRIQLEKRISVLSERILSLENQLSTLHSKPAPLLLNTQLYQYHLDQRQDKLRFDQKVAQYSNPNQPLLLTNTGIYVKSKSEVLICNQLAINNLTHFYEKPLPLKSRTVHPDFTIELPTRTKYWEHIGLTNDPQYMDNWWKKHQAYIEMGYLEGRDLIVTYEYDGFDSQYIQKVIDLQLLS